MKESEEEMFSAVREEIIRRFYVQMHRLPEQQREILLDCLKGKKTGEIAARLRLTTGKVESSKRQAYEYLYKHLEDGLSLACLKLLD